VSGPFEWGDGVVEKPTNINKILVFILGFARVTRKNDTHWGFYSTQRIHNKKITGSKGQVANYLFRKRLTYEY
jgi:hypothetical protein